MSAEQEATKPQALKGACSSGSSKKGLGPKVSDVHLQDTKLPTFEWAWAMVTAKKTTLDEIHTYTPLCCLESDRLLSCEEAPTLLSLPNSAKLLLHATWA